MRILQINAVNGIASTGRTCTELADYLNNHGHEGYIAWSEGKPYPMGMQIGDSFEKKLHGLLSRITGKQAYFSYCSTKKLLLYITSLNPDVVHLRNLHGNYINLPKLLTYLSRNNIPTVLTLHDCWFYTGKCCHYTTAGCYKWMTECGGCPKLKTENISWFFDKTNLILKDKKRLFESIPYLAVVGVSDWITNEASKSILSNAKVITRIYNWVDLNVFHPLETVELRKNLNLQDKKVILGVASGWGVSKGINGFVELSKKLSAEYVVILIGNMPQSISLPGNILSIPIIDDASELARYYSLADVFVTLSLEESFGKVSAEALACGTPVICFNSTANPELVDDGCGYIIEKGNIDELVNSINKVCLEGKRAYSDACVTFAKSNFDKDTLIKEYLKLYTAISSR
jgi:glycosyltransferase involved in cell wall biosynthesis